MSVGEPRRRELLISKGWVQAAVLVFLCGFAILGLLAYRTYTASPPVPKRVVGPSGQVVFTGKDISEGQQVFLHNGLMEYGSAFGHGAYLGPDYTADYLRRAANSRPMPPSSAISERTDHTRTFAVGVLSTRGSGGQVVVYE